MQEQTLPSKNIGTEAQLRRPHRTRIDKFCPARFSSGRSGKRLGPRMEYIFPPYARCSDPVNLNGSLPANPETVFSHIVYLPKSFFCMNQ